MKSKKMLLHAVAYSLLFAAVSVQASQEPSGMDYLEELRKKLRIGMGPCQGRVCIQLVTKILEKKTGRKVSKIPLPTSRPPEIPVSLGTLASDKDEK